MTGVPVPSGSKKGSLAGTALLNGSSGTAFCVLKSDLCPVPSLLTMKFFKYHALGNDYLVLDPKDFPGELTERKIRVLCHRNFGIGSDGILWGPLTSEKSRFALRIFNPDGSEAEKSGNGLRIFSRFLWDQKRVGSEEFSLQTPGGHVKSTVMEAGKTVRVEMGQVSFWSDVIPVTGSRREVLSEKITVGDRTF